jgi:hypothetical protein
MQEQGKRLMLIAIPQAWDVSAPKYRLDGRYDLRP